jgi:hypothetical protein
MPRKREDDSPMEHLMLMGFHAPMFGLMFGLAFLGLAALAQWVMPHFVAAFMLPQILAIFFWTIAAVALVSAVVGWLYHGLRKRFAPDVAATRATGAAAEMIARPASVSNETGTSGAGPI